MLTISIGLSRCLLGDLVRYDGKGKYSEICVNEFKKPFSLCPICPEVEAGLPTPRPAVELVQHATGIKLIGREEKQLDITVILNNFCKKKVYSLGFLSGFIVMPRSPSCGFKSTPRKSIAGDVLSHDSGIFTQALHTKFPLLPLIEEPLLSDLSIRLGFQLQVIYYYLTCHLSPSKQNTVLSKANIPLARVVQNHKSKVNIMSAINESLSKLTTQQLHQQLVMLRKVLNDMQ